MGDTEADPIAEAYTKANQLNVRLATKYDPAMATEARRVAEQLLGYIREQVEDYEDFVQRAERSELFSLHESAQLKKGEVRLKGLYMRATGLLETIKDWEQRKKR